MPYSQWFLVSADGACRWLVRHQVTGELAGTIVRTPGGYVLRNDHDHPVGSFGTIEGAVEGLYEFV